ncbi:MAG TPA: LCP family protein [Candidatus Limnocylindria bacterium]|nr:LCP family protein [Candidatus Limnocylindria bacterium]
MIRRMSRNSMMAVLLAGLMTGASGMGGPVLAASDVHFSPLPLLKFANQVFGEQTVLGAVEALTGQAQVSAGSDGRITVLAVGSDHRDGKYNGERTDTILIMSINTNNHMISAASIPRDTARVPLAPALGGGIFTDKINGMLKWFKKQSGGSRAAGMEKLRIEIEYLVATPIDYVAYIRFDGFDTLVDEAGGIQTSISAEIRDPDYIDRPGYPVGARFLADNSVVLGGAQAERCYGGYPKPVKDWSTVMSCHRALVYVRSRHGKVGSTANNDFKRSARQQSFIYDALRQLRNTPSTAQSVRAKANDIPMDFYTTIPISTPADGVALLNLADGATMPYRVVFSPSTYATKVSAHYELKLTAVRAWCDQYMGPV